MDLRLATRSEYHITWIFYGKAMSSILPFANRNVLISGGCGFIGSMLARRLVESGARVTLIDSLIPSYGGNLANIADIRDRVWLNISDVRDPHAMSQLIQNQDFLFNLAGQTSHLDSMTDPFTDLAINASAQLSILEVVRKFNPGIRIVFASTRQLYGKPRYLPVDENHPIVPVDINGIHKLAGEGYHLLYQSVYGIRSTCLRLTNTYGPGMRVKDARQTFLGIWLKLLLTGEPIKVFGTGEQLRDFNYVDDVVDALLLAATREEAIGKVMNLGSDEVISLKDLAQLLVNINGAGAWEIVPFPADRKAIDIGDYYGDWKLANSLLGWTPKINLAEGLKRSLLYYRMHGSAYWGNA
jgi:dTDP-glucose 4,6-dehydratase/UDP-glucose 4-epimerase